MRSAARAWRVFGVIVVIGSLTPGASLASTLPPHVLNIGPPAPFTATSGRWTLVPTAQSPPGGSSTMEYDAADGFTFLYTGTAVNSSGRCVPSGSDWSYARGAWSPVTSSNPPSPRGSGALAYDAGDGYVVLFGGVGCQGQWFNDTWSFHAGSWKNLSSSVSPPPRESAKMTYDAADRSVLLFGGYGPLPGGSFARLSDTWEFRGGNWTQVRTSPTPPARNLFALSYDVADAEAVLYGGEREGTGSCCFLSGDTWTFASGEWKNVTPGLSPPPRASPAMAYDPEASALILFGGGGVGSVTPSVFADTWSFSAGIWTAVSAGASPSARPSAAMTYDSADGYLVLFGGPSGTAPMNDTWAFGPPLSNHGTSTFSLAPWEYVVIAAAAVLLVALALLVQRRKPALGKVAGGKGGTQQGTSSADP